LLLNVELLLKRIVSGKLDIVVIKHLRHLVSFLQILIGLVRNIFQKSFDFEIKFLDFWL